MKALTTKHPDYRALSDCIAAVFITLFSCICCDELKGQSEPPVYPVIEQGHEWPIQHAFLTENNQYLISWDERRLLCRDYSSGRLWNALNAGRDFSIRCAVTDNESRRLCVVYQPTSDTAPWLAEFYQLPGLQFAGSRQLPVNKSLPPSNANAGCAGCFEEYSWKVWLHNGNTLYSADLTDSLVWFMPMPAARVLGLFPDFGRKTILAINTPDQSHTQIITLSGFQVLNIQPLHKAAHHATFNRGNRRLILTEDSLIFHYRVNLRGIPVFFRLLAHDWKKFRNLASYMNPEGDELYVLMGNRKSTKPQLEALRDLADGKQESAALFRFALDRNSKKSEPVAVALCNMLPAPRILFRGPDASFIAASYRSISEFNTTLYGMRMRTFHSAENNVQQISKKHGSPLLAHGGGVLDLSKGRPWHPTAAEGRESWTWMLQHSNSCVSMVHSDSGVRLMVFPTRGGPALRKSGLLPQSGSFMPELSRRGMMVSADDRWLFMPDFLQGRYQIFDLKQPNIPAREFRLSDSGTTLLLQAAFSPNADFLYLLSASSTKIISLSQPEHAVLDLPALEMHWLSDSSLAFTDGDSIQAIHLGTGRRISLEKASSKFRVFCASGISGSYWYYENGTFAVRDTNYKILKAVALSAGLPESLLADPADNRLYIAHGQEVHVYALDSLKPLFIIFSKGTTGFTDYIIRKAASNDYMAGPLAASQMHFIHHGSVSGILSPRFTEYLHNRPDRILPLTNHTDAAYLNALEQLHQTRLKLYAANPETEEMRLNEALNKSIPVLRVHSLRQDPTKARADLFLAVRMSRLRSIDTQNLRVLQWHNFQYTGTSGTVDRRRTERELRQGRLTHDEILLRYDLPLLEGKNRFTFAFTDRHEKLHAPPIEFDLYHHSKNPMVPDLYYVGIGVSQYLDSNYNLQYACKDAGDIQAALVNSYHRYGYGHFHALTLCNTEADSNFPGRVASFLAHARRQDRVIVSFSGHGLLDEKLRYYLAPYAMDFQSPVAHGVPVERLRDAVGNAAPLHKLLLLDACHSGTLLSNEPSDTMFAAPEGTTSVQGIRGAWTRNASLRKEADESDLMQAYFSMKNDRHGTVILAASGGREYALEGNGFRNGVFTASFIEAWQQESDIGGLARATAARVVKRTQGAQTPCLNQIDYQFNWNFRLKP